MKKALYKPVINMDHKPGMTYGKVYEIVKYIRKGVNNRMDKVCLYNDIGEYVELYVFGLLDDIIFKDVTLEHRDNTIDDILS